MIATVYDQAASTRPAIQALRADSQDINRSPGKEPQGRVIMKVQEIVHLVDVPQLLKGLRNNFSEKDLLR